MRRPRTPSLLTCVQAVVHALRSVQSFLPLPQSATGVFQNLIDRQQLSGASAKNCLQEPLASVFMIEHALLFTVLPQVTAASWTFGVEMHRHHLYAQFGCCAFDDIIHVSSQPVTPSFGVASETDFFAAFSWLY